MPTCKILLVKGAEPRGISQVGKMGNLTKGISTLGFNVNYLGDFVNGLCLNLFLPHRLCLTRFPTSQAHGFRLCFHAGLR